MADVSIAIGMPAEANILSSLYKWQLTFLTNLFD